MANCSLLKYLFLPLVSFSLLVLFGSLSTSSFFLLDLLASFTTSSSHLKSLHFSLYQQETINKTGCVIARTGVAGEGITQTTMHFGTVSVFIDNMTVTADPFSTVIGIAEGTSKSSSFDWVAKFTVQVKNHNGSVSIVGYTRSLKRTEHPVIGGTGDFQSVQGYVTSSPAYLNGDFRFFQGYFTSTGLLAAKALQLKPPVSYKIEFHLYWPPCS